jgi:hypothetical protein
VRNLGPATAWYTPFKKVFISRAYAGAGGSFTTTIIPDGSLKGSVWEAPARCVGARSMFPGIKGTCSVPFIKIGTDGAGRID